MCIAWPLHITGLSSADSCTFSDIIWKATFSSRSRMSKCSCKSTNKNSKPIQVEAQQSEDACECDAMIVAQKNYGQCNSSRNPQEGYEWKHKDAQKLIGFVAVLWKQAKNLDQRRCQFHVKENPKAVIVVREQDNCCSMMKKNVRFQCSFCQIKNCIHDQVLEQDIRRGNRVKGPKDPEDIHAVQGAGHLGAKEGPKTQIRKGELHCSIDFNDLCNKSVDWTVRPINFQDRSHREIEPTNNRIKNRNFGKKFSILSFAK